MNNFKKSLCSASITLALCASANSFAQDEQPAAGGGSDAEIKQGYYTGVSQGNDSSIDMVGIINSATIVVEGTDNISTIEQINTISFWGSEAQAWTGSATDAGAAYNTNNINTITQVGGRNKAVSKIGVGSDNTVSVYQAGVPPIGAYANQSWVNVNGDANSVDINQSGLSGVVKNIIDFDITGDDNTATINMKSDAAFLGTGPFASQPSHLTGNGNTLVADIYDAGNSDTLVEMTGDNNSVTIDTTGDSSNGKDKTILIKQMVGSDNTFVINSHGDGGYHNLGKITGDDNQINVTDNGGFNNRTIMANWKGSDNTIDVTTEGTGNNQVNLSLSDGDSNETTVYMSGDSNDILRLNADGNNNTWQLSASGTGNRIKASANNDQWNPGFRPTTGDDNTMIITQEGDNNFAAYMDAGDRRLYNTKQIGNDNSSLVQGIGNDKGVWITQDGNNNDSELTYDRVEGPVGQLPANRKEAGIKQIGDHNSSMVDIKATASTFIKQFGSFNSVDLSVTGNNDEFGTVAFIGEILQEGMGNTYQADIQSSQWSRQWINQIGDDNFIHWEEGGGSQNHTFIDQTGDMNSAYVTLNLWDSSVCCSKVEVLQTGDYNEVDLDISGNWNGEQAKSGYRGGIVVVQEGEDNLLVGNDGFAFTINGDHNKLFVKQVGTGNTAAGHMLGGANTADIHQYGDNNFASITMSAY